MLLGALAALVLALTASASATRTQSRGSTVTLNVANLAAMQYLAFYTADSLGYFAKYGIKMNYVQTSSIVPSLIAGSVQLGLTGADSAIVSASQGAPTPMLMVLQQKNSLSFAVRSDEAPTAKGYPLNITTLKRPMTIGVNALGGGCYTYAAQVVQQAGLKQGTDYNFVALGSGGAILAAMQAHTIDAACLFPPYDAQAVNQNLAVLVTQEALQNGPNLAQRYGNGVFAAPNWVNANPTLAKDIVTAIEQAMTWMQDPKHKAQLIQITSKYLEASGAVDNSAITKDLPGVVKLAQPYYNCGVISGMEKILVQVGSINQLPACGNVIWEKYAPKAPKAK